MRLSHGLSAACLYLIACDAAADGAGDRVDVPVTLVASTPTGAHVRDARLYADGRALGVTGESGELAALLHGVVGRRVHVAVICPAGHTGPREDRSLALAATREPIRVTSTCTPDVRLLPLIVRARHGARGVALPVTLDGQPIAQTNADGVSHLLLRLPAGTTARVGLDTSKLPRLQPQSPVRAFPIEDTTQLLLLDQGFDVTQRRRQTDPPPRRPSPKRPYRLE